MSERAKRVDRKAALRDRARVVLWGLAILIATLIASVLLAQNSTGALLAQLVIAEFGTGRIGVAWSDPLAAIPSGKEIARRAGRGFFLGAAAAIILMGSSVATHAMTLGIGSFNIAALLAGLVTSACVAARNELLLRGLVLRALGPSASFDWRLAACGAAGVAFRFGTEPSAQWPALVFTLLTSVACACLWMRDRGAWLAVSASTAFMFVSGPLSQGAVIDLRGPAPIDASLAAILCGVVIAISAIVWTGRRVASPK